MNYIEIAVPAMNDSLSRVVLEGTAYYFRMQYNDTGGYWMFSLYTSTRNPLLSGAKVIPGWPLNAFCLVPGMPHGAFYVLSQLDSIGHDDFVNGNAKLIFIPGGEYS